MLPPSSGCDAVHLDIKRPTSLLCLHFIYVVQRKQHKIITKLQLPLNFCSPYIDMGNKRWKGKVVPVLN